MIEAVNRQRKTKIDTKAWETFAARAAGAIGKKDSSATIAFVSDKTIRQLNRQFRGVDKATDVLSFPAADEERNLGDIAISVETAAGDVGISRIMALRCAVRRASKSLEFISFISIKWRARQKTKDAETAVQLLNAGYPRNRAPYTRARRSTRV